MRSFKYDSVLKDDSGKVVANVSGRIFSDGSSIDSEFPKDEAAALDHVRKRLNFHGEWDTTVMYDGVRIIERTRVTKMHQQPTHRKTVSVERYEVPKATAVR